MIPSDELIINTLETLDKIRSRIESPGYDAINEIYIAMNLEKLQRIQVAVDSQFDRSRQEVSSWITECPNPFCSAVWGFDELQFQQCDACGWPDTESLNETEEIDEEGKEVPHASG